MKNAYQLPVSEVLKSVQSTEEGLTSKVAEERLAENGENILEEENKKSAIKILLSQFSNMMILFLILVGIVSFVYSLVAGESFIEAIVIFACVLVNAMMGFIQDVVILSQGETVFP